MIPSGDRLSASVREAPSEDQGAWVVRDGLPYRDEDEQRESEALLPVVVRRDALVDQEP